MVIRPRDAWHETPRLNWVSGALRRVLNVVFSLQSLLPHSPTTTAHFSRGFYLYVYTYIFPFRSRPIVPLTLSRSFFYPLLSHYSLLENLLCERIKQNKRQVNINLIVQVDRVYATAYLNPFAKWATSVSIRTFIDSTYMTVAKLCCFKFYCT